MKPLRRETRAHGGGRAYVVFHAYGVYWQRPITEEEIQREMRNRG